MRDKSHDQERHHRHRRGDDARLEAWQSSLNCIGQSKKVRQRGGLPAPLVRVALVTAHDHCCHRADQRDLQAKGSHR